MENPEISGTIQMERFILVEIFRIKRNTFRGITFFRFLPKRPKFSVPFVWITSARLQVERKRKIYRYFEKLMIQLNPVPVSGAQNKSQCHLTEIFRWNFRTNGKRLNFPPWDLLLFSMPFLYCLLRSGLQASWNRFVFHCLRICPHQTRTNVWVNSFRLWRINW